MHYIKFKQKTKQYYKIKNGQLIVMIKKNIYLILWVNEWKIISDYLLLKLFYHHNEQFPTNYYHIIIIWRT